MSALLAPSARATGTLLACLLVVGGLTSASSVSAARPHARPVADAPIEDYGSLLRRLKRVRGAAAKRDVARTFAMDARVRISDRLRALLVLSPVDDREAFSDDLLAARLFAVARNARGRDRRLRLALVHAEAIPDARATAIRIVREADTAYATALAHLKARQRRADASALSPDEARLQAFLFEAMPAYQALADTFRWAEVQYLLARFLELSDAPRDAVLRAYTPLIRVGGQNRDTAALRQKVRRARARVLLKLRRYRDAAYTSLVADNVRVVPVTEPAFAVPPRDQYRKSPETEALCREVFAQTHIRCADIQRERMDTLTLFDFTRLPQRSAMNAAWAERVWQEYAPLFDACMTGHLGAPSSEVRVTFGVEQDGHTAHVRVLPPDTAARTCIEERLRAMRYPRHKGEPWHEMRVWSAVPER